MMQVNYQVPFMCPWHLAHQHMHEVRVLPSKVRNYLESALFTIHTEISR